MKAITDAELQEVLGITSKQVELLRELEGTKLAPDEVTIIPSTLPLAKVIRAGIITLVGK
jgi:hypothetical protein